MTLAAIRLPPEAAAPTILDLWDRGEAVLPLDPRAPADDVARTLAALRPTHLIDADGSRRLDNGVDAAPEVAAVIATSGTTRGPERPGQSGRLGPERPGHSGEPEPRGVELSWNGLRASALAVSDTLDATAEDTWLCCLPVHHVAGLAILARAWVTGTGLEVVPTFDPAALRRSEASLVSLVPVTVRRALDAGVDLGRFRRVLVGGAPVPEELRRRAQLLDVPLVGTYGLTETWGGVVHDGSPLPGVRLRLGQAREIEVHCPMVMRAYRFRPEETAAALSEDGWLHTGDVGAFDGGGRLQVVDRLGDVIITGGVNVSPTEVESVLATHPALADVCVAGAPDAEWGQRVVAYVVPAPGTTAPDVAALRQFAANKLAGPKLPRQVVVVKEVPRSAGGKVLRRRLVN